MKKQLALILLTITTAKAASNTPQIGGFIDTYYAYDTNNPQDHEREYTTQPTRHNEFNVNLAYLEAKLAEEKTRGRLALQFGHSVIKNTTGEPRKGATSGPQDAKVFQEAYVGKRLGPKTWIDMGIFLGNIGSESWISKDNWTYTRALFLDYVPYYSSGVRLEHNLDETQSFQVQILNGWQNMSENNQGKALGFQYKKDITQSLNFTYNNFLGDEKVVSDKSRFRSYHNFILKWLKSDKWQYLFAYDFGHQSQQNNKGVDPWMATALTIRQVFDEEHSIATRFEYYNDYHEANITTGTPNGFEVLGASMNYDQKIDKNALWRTELRGFYSKDKIYPEGLKYRNRLDGFLVTSLSLWF